MWLQHADTRHCVELKDIRCILAHQLLRLFLYFLKGPGALEIGILKLHGTDFQVNFLTIVRLSVFQDILR